MTHADGREEGIGDLGGGKDEMVGEKGKKKTITVMKMWKNVDEVELTT